MKNRAHRSSAVTLGSITVLYQQPMPSTRTGPLYNAFSYPTKISPEAIALFIASHTAPGGIVMDTFAGSCTTGLATKLCDRPTPEMLQMARTLGLNPTWGPRHAILYELGAIGSFVGEVMCNPPDPKLFASEAEALVSDAYARLGSLLTVLDRNGQPGVLRHAIWTEVLVCPHCGHEHTFWDAAVKHDPLSLRPADEQYACPSCRKKISLGVVTRATEQVYDDLLGRVVERRKRVPVRIYGKNGKTKWQRPVTPVDIATLAAADKHPQPSTIPVEELKLGDLYRSGYHFGITHLHHLYTRRNLICLATLLELIEQRHPDVREALRLLVLSYNQSHATLMTRVVVKDGESDFVLTGAQSGVLYISSLPVEKNVLEGVTRKVKAFSDSFALVRGSRSTVVVRNQSSTHLCEANNSVDYVFTDPPFADFIPYSEINQINELWLGKLTNDEEEAVMSPAQGKALDDYQQLMASVFGEISRVLRPTGAATVVFHAAKASVWSALQTAYRSAGLDVAATNVLDKLQASFKQVVSTVSVKGDPLLMLTKRMNVQECDASNAILLIDRLVNDALHSRDPADREPERLYSRYVTHCLENGSQVELDARHFYAAVEAASA